ncbi:hypothetical protein ACIQUQ_16620 [Streptomyces sp. NPDC101118]|uniref:hypothetical protein n=1 Tax=unclassified Streptomyces TaxID=2593676 RepID=UPI003826D9CB
MSGSLKAMAVLLVGALVVISAYSATIGSNGWLWFAWIVLALLTAGVAASRSA